jgi:hypothetical protein
MNYKKALNDDEEIVEHEGVKIFGVSLLVWVLSGLVFVAIAAFASHTLL